MKKTIFGLLFVLIFSIGLLSAAELPPNSPTPHAFYGSVLESNGDDVLEGYITAKLNGVITGVSEVKQGTYGYGSNALIVLSYDGKSGTIKFYYGEEEIGEHDFIDAGMVNLDFIVDPSEGLENPADGICELDECSSNALDCNVDKTKVCLGNSNCDLKIGENCLNAPTDCGACPIQTPANTGNTGNTGGNGGNGGNGGSSISSLNTNKTATNTTSTNVTDTYSNLDVENKTDEEGYSGLGFLETTPVEEKDSFGKITGRFFRGIVDEFRNPVGVTFIILFIIIVFGISLKIRKTRKAKSE